MSDKIEELKRNLDHFRSVFETEYTWKAGFMRNVDRYGMRTALIYPAQNREWTYQELNGEVNRFCNALLEDGIQKGDVLMYQMLNCPEFVFTYIASHKIGAVNSPMNYRLSSGEIALNLEDSEPAVLIFEVDQAEVIQEALEISAFRPKRLIAVRISPDDVVPEWSISYDEYVRDFSSDEPQVDWEFNIYDETTRLYTSGTTGRQKGVPVTSINEVLSAHDVIMHFPLDFRDVTMNTTPWFHRGGLHCAGPGPMFYVGGTVVIMRKFDAAVCLDQIEKYHLTFVVGVPAVLERLTKEQMQKARDLSSLHGIVTMGSPLERAACIRYQEVLTPNVFNGYGTTETFWNTFLRPFNLPDMAGTAGISCVDDEVRVVHSYPDHRAEPDDLVAKDGKEVGEIIIRSAAKSSYCFYNNAAETEKKFYRGFAYTNDLGTWDENQFISITGRKDDMIISAGENIYPTQVEEVLNSCELVEDCVVTAAPDLARGQLVTAYVIPKDENVTAAQIDSYCKDSPMLANYKRPRYYRFVKELPMNATGKKLHNVVKKMAEEDLKAGKLEKC